MFFDTGNPKSWSTLKPEVGLELTVFRRIISNKITKNGEKWPQNTVWRPSFANTRAKKDESAFKMPYESLFSRAYMLFDTGNPNLRSIFKAEVVIMVLLRMRNNKVDTVNPNLKCILKPDKVCFRADAKVFFSRLECRTSGPFWNRV